MPQLTKQETEVTLIQLRIWKSRASLSILGRSWKHRNLKKKDVAKKSLTKVLLQAHVKQTNANNPRCFFLATDDLGESIFADPGSFGTSIPCRTTCFFFAWPRLAVGLRNPEILGDHFGPQKHSLGPTVEWFWSVCSMVFEMVLYIHTYMFHVYSKLIASVYQRTSD